MDKHVLLEQLPPFTNRFSLIRKNQTVGDIVKEVLAAHETFAPDYDLIASGFDRGSNIETAKALFDFLKRNVRYKVESERSQTTKSPAAILTTAVGDCKHYSGFIAGVLDALKRMGRKIAWHYRFASYNAFDQLPGHVFVVLNQNGKEYWIDPVLKGFNERVEPTYILDKTPNSNYMLQRLSGINDPAALDVYDEEDQSISPEITNAIALLYQYGIINSEGKVNDDLLAELSSSLPSDEFNKLANARIMLHSAAIGGLFSKIWKGVKKVSLAAPRNAFLSIIGINAFGLATKLSNALYNKDGSYYEAFKTKLQDLWDNKFSGDFSKLENTIKHGMKRKAILGAAPAALPAWVAVASALIAAVTPIINNAIKEKAAANQLPAGIDPLTGLPHGMNMPEPDAGNPFMDFIKNNPAIVVAAAAAGVYFYTNRKKRN